MLLLGDFVGRSASPWCLESDRRRRGLEAEGKRREKGVLGLAEAQTTAKGG